MAACFGFGSSRGSAMSARSLFAAVSDARSWGRSREPCPSGVLAAMLSVEVGVKSSSLVVMSRFANRRMSSSGWWLLASASAGERATPRNGVSWRERSWARASGLDSWWSAMGVERASAAVMI